MPTTLGNQSGEEDSDSEWGTQETSQSSVTFILLSEVADSWDDLHLNLVRRSSTILRREYTMWRAAANQGIIRA